MSEWEPYEFNRYPNIRGRRFTEVLRTINVDDHLAIRGLGALLARRTRYGPLDVKVYGDATGDSRKSAASRTDWQMVGDFFKRNGYRYRVHMDVPSSNPPVKDRVNCVNAVILNAEGKRRLEVAPVCQQLIRDLEQVCWKTDSNGNIVSELDHSDPTRTHMSDALGYLIARKFPMLGTFGEMPGFVR